MVTPCSLSFRKSHRAPFKSVSFDRVIPGFSRRRREAVRKLSILGVARRLGAARGLFKRGDRKMLIIAAAIVLCHSRKPNDNLAILTS